MGTDSKKAPPLPAPTETDTTTPTELTTDISKPGDENSTYSLPEDGTPVTIRTRGPKANRSQTSLLIEYFEGGKTSTSASGTERKPSVRVRLTPSKKAKGDHFQVTETKGSRKVSLSRRVPVDHSPSQDLDVPEGEDAHSMTSYASATEESNVSRNPIDIEIDRPHRRRRPASPLIPSDERLSYQPGNPSEISAIAPDSFLDGTGPGGDVRSSGHSKGDVLAGAALGAAAGAIGNEVLQNSKTRGNAKERVKLSEKEKGERSDKKRRSKSRTSSVSEQHAEGVRSPRRRSSRSHQESTVSAGDSALSSYASASHRSLDNRSVRSGASKASSINNPKLLETVEDAIRRLILPELSALKREQSKRENRRSSLTSTGTSASKEEGYTERRRSSSKTDATRDSPRNRERRNREARHDYDDISMHSPSRESLGEYRSRDITSPKRSGDLLKAAAAGAAGAAAIKGLSSAFEDGSESADRKQRERRRRRADSRSRSLGRETYDDEHGDYLEPAPPMPLMSDINPSEVTRTSILSVDSDRPHSAMEELDTPRDRDVGGAPITSAPVTPTPQLSLDVPPMSTQHANVSHGDLTALPRGNKDYVEEYETDEFGRKIPLNDSYYEGDVPPAVPDYDEYDEEPPYDNGYYSVQDVPPPLKYVPYQAGARGLSPIPSVSGYTEAGSEAHLPHHSRSMQSASPDKSPQRLYQSRSIHSMDSIQLSPDNPKNPRFESNTAAGEEVRGISANPDFVHPPFGVESAVASLVEGSALDQSVITTGSGYDQARDSVVSYDSPIKDGSRGFSPEKLSMDSRREYEEDRATPGSRSLAQSHEYSEYELDENGRKVPRARYRQSPTASEAAITVGAVGAAAAALKAAKERKQAAAEGRLEEDFEPAGVFRNKSFKERAMRWQPRNTPTHSLDRYDDEEDEHQPTMTASGMPNLNDPMPEIGYIDDDLETNPSVIQGPIGGNSKDLRWEEHVGQTTPTAKRYDPMDIDSTPRSKNIDQHGLGMKEAAGAAALGAAAAMAASGVHHDATQEPDEWRRTSAERKRDTLITNPYEDASPVTNPALDGDLLKSGALESDFGEPIAAENAHFGQKFDEGYMSNGPNATPDMANRSKGLDLSGAANPLDDDEDPFYVSKENPRHLSGMSQGMASPFYDASTGAGMDRIENKDIVALMQHLMVRDAQRSARDTEIVALLMNAALEMKNSFREMKELVQDTGDDMIFANVENTEKLQKAINGPRPIPGGASRSLQSPSQAGTDEVMKKKNLWRRALQGLGSKGTNDLTRIEDMLVQLLGEVNDLKTQNGTTAPASARGQSMDNTRSVGQADQDHDDDYDHEDDSVADVSGYTTETATATRVHMTRANTEPKFVDHQMSTVQEHDEEYLYDQPASATERGNPGLLSPGYDDRQHRGSSVPLDTPPNPDFISQPAALSAENTPKSDKGKKHKSSSSSGWIPKISRWSETTASSVGRAFRGSGASKKGKYDDYQPPSRSGSSLASYDDAARQHDPYGEDKLHSGFSDQNLPTDDIPVAGIPPPPAFMLSDDPKYKAHRNSVNLQHPQPRQGQTERYRTALEYSAQAYDSPTTPRSADWEGSATSLSRLPGNNSNRYSNASSMGAKDADYALASSGQQPAPPRPPKEPLDNSSVHTPQKASRVSQLQKDSPLANPSYESGYGSATGTQASHYTERSPKFENRNLTGARGMPTRRPSGPRAMTPKSPEEEAAREERRRKRDTFGTVESNETDTF